MSASTRTSLNWLAVISWTLPVVLFIGLLARSAVDVPQWDDFPSILAFAGDWQTAAGAGAKWALLHEQYFSHRIVLTKLATLALLLTTGHVNFFTLQALGWTGWIVVFALVARQLPAGQRTGWAVLPLALLLMQPQGYSNHLIAMQAVQNIGIILWAFGALGWLDSENRAARAAALALLATAPLVSANGLMVLPAACASVVLRGNFRRLASVLPAGAAGWAVFLAGYTSTAKPLALGEVAANAAAMAGGPVAVLTLGTREALVAGAILLVASGWLLLRRSRWRAAPVPTAWLCFLVLSVLMAARGRVGWGTTYMLQDRYRLYGVLIAALLYVAVLPALQARWPTWLLVVGTATAGLFCLVSYVSSWPLAAADLAWARASAHNRQFDRWIPYTGSDYWAYATTQLQRAEKLGLYHLPNLLAGAAVRDVRALKPSSSPHNLAVADNPDVFGRSLLPDRAWPRPAFVLIAGDQPLVLPVQRYRASLREAFSHATVFGPDYSIPLPDRVAAGPTPTIAAVGLDASGRARELWTASVGAIAP